MRNIGLFLAIFIGGMMGLAACNSAEQPRAENSPTTAPGGNRAVPPAPADGIRRITVDELKALMQKDEVLVVDVRNEDVYNVAHIRGAKLVPLEDTLKHIDELPKDKLIVTYCA